MNILKKIKNRVEYKDILIFLIPLIIFGVTLVIFFQVCFHMIHLIS